MAENIGKLNYQITADQSAFTVGMAKASSDVEKFSQTCRNQSNASAATFDGLAKAAGSSFSGLQTGGLAGGFGALKASVAELCFPWVASQLAFSSVWPPGSRRSPAKRTT